jgi:hypothetical protein
LFLLLSFLSFEISNAQKGLNNFLKPSDSLNSQRRNTVVISEVLVSSITLVGLNQLWYADYPKSKFHFINDNSEWMQMDKMGHLFSCYHISNMSVNALKWAGVQKDKQLIYSTALGLTFMTTVEIFDGFSEQWGASSEDLVANIAGTGLFVSQEILWKEQRIIPKFSFHTTQYAALRPNLLGNSINEQILKDYNGQTYWLSANVNSFLKSPKIPNWLNFAIGFGAEGIISANGDYLASEPKRYRQLFLSLDVDLTRIKTKSPLLKTLFSVFNCIKVPAPTIEFSRNSQLKGHFIYF